MKLRESTTRKSSKRKLWAFLGILVTASFQTACLADDGNRGRLYGSQFELIALDARIDGVPLRLAIDTSASHTFLDSKHAAILGLKPSEPNSRRSLHEGNFSLALCGKELPLSTIGLVDLRALAQFGGLKPPDGILGQDVLEQIRLVLDFEDMECGILKKTHPIPRNMVGIRTHLVAGEPAIVAMVDGKRRSFVIATAVVATGQIYPLRREIAKWKITGGRHVMSAADGSVALVSYIRGPKLELGPFAHDNLVFQANVRAPASRLGAEYWRRYGHVIMDFGNQRIYLASGRAFESPTYEDACGLLLEKKGTRTVVAGTAIDSVARKHNLPVGAVLIRIDDHIVEDIEEAYIRLRGAGKEMIKIEYEFRGERRELLLRRISI